MPLECRPLVDTFERFNSLARRKVNFVSRTGARKTTTMGVALSKEQKQHLADSIAKHAVALMNEVERQQEREQQQQPEQQQYGSDDDVD